MLKIHVKSERIAARVRGSRKALKADHMPPSIANAAMRFLYACAPWSAQKGNHTL